MSEIKQWKQLPTKPINGYTVLMPVPGDLPVFTKIALDTISRQSHENLVEILVIPDKLVPGFFELLEDWRHSFKDYPIRLLKPIAFEKLVARLINNYPHHIHWLQIVRGVSEVLSTHALLHDADLFITEQNFLETHYKVCAERDLSCLGVSPVWDSWYQESGINHLVATWEMIFNVSWFKGFSPLDYRGQERSISGKIHYVDTALWPQYQTSSNQIDRHQQEWGFIHFNHVICTYRWFQKTGIPFEDEYFRILLIRLLIDSYAPSGWVYDVPTLSNLINGINDKSNSVTYLSEEARKNYEPFRKKLDALINNYLVDDLKAEVIDKELKSFEKLFI